MQAGTIDGLIPKVRLCADIFSWRWVRWVRWVDGKGAGDGGMGGWGGCYKRYSVGGYCFACAFGPRGALLWDKGETNRQKELSALLC